MMTDNTNTHSNFLLQTHKASMDRERKDESVPGGSRPSSSRASQKLRNLFDNENKLDQMLFMPYQLAAMKDKEEDEEDRDVEWPDKNEKNKNKGRGRDSSFSDSDDDDLPDPDRYQPKKRTGFVAPFKKNTKKRKLSKTLVTTDGQWSVAGVKAIRHTVTTPQTSSEHSSAKVASPRPGTSTDSAGDNPREDTMQGEDTVQGEDTLQEEQEVSKAEGMRNLLLGVRIVMDKNLQCVKKVQFTPILEQLLMEDLYPKGKWKVNKDKAYTLKKLVQGALQQFKLSKVVPDGLADESTSADVAKLLQEIADRDEDYASGKIARNFGGKGELNHSQKSFYASKGRCKN